MNEMKHLLDIFRSSEAVERLNESDRPESVYDDPGDANPTLRAAMKEFAKAYVDLDLEFQNEQFPNYPKDDIETFLDGLNLAFEQRDSGNLFTKLIDEMKAEYLRRTSGSVTEAAAPAQEGNVYFVLQHRHPNQSSGAIRAFTTLDLLHQALTVDVEDFQASTAILNKITSPVAAAVVAQIMHSRTATREVKDWLRHTGDAAMFYDDANITFAVGHTQRDAYETYMRNTQ